MSAAVEELIERMTLVERRYTDHAAKPLPAGLSDPDPGETERWEAGQVWAHVAEFPDYWLAQAATIVAADPADDPVPFGRTKTDAGRLDAIERDRHTDPAALLTRVRDSLIEVSDTLRSWPDEAWTRQGLHPVRGPMAIDAIIERFIVAHLEEHADQLDGIAAASR
jgi:hypothetical protein